MNSTNVCLTFPKEMLAKIDESRGDASRSRYILRLVQKAYYDNSDQKGEEN